METSGVLQRTGEPVLKYVPSDFLVRENLVVALKAAEESDQRYLLLRKQGYTTFEAVGAVADRFGIPRRSVTYAGLKDEDGITEQLVAVPLAAAADLGAAWRLSAEDRWLELQHYGYGAEPLAIGALEGNSFRTVVRNLDAERAERIAAAASSVHVFVNYYDVQRFGVPTGPKLTHLVGAAILAGDWSTALTRVVELKAPESPAAGAWTGSPQGFFDQMDPRTVSFYLAAHSSYEWNATVREAIRRTCPGQYRSVRVDGLEYLYLTSPRAALSLLVDAPTVPYQRYEYSDGGVSNRLSTRTTVVQTRLRVSTPEPDELVAGTYRVTLGFPLPSGCYATAALRQLLAYGDVAG
jgi:tRNA pseudouridine13 synthase